jgi:hypothetical protein
MEERRLEPVAIPGPGLMGQLDWLRQGRRRLILISILAAAAVIVLGWPAWAAFNADWLWFQSLGYQTVFSTILVTKMTLGVTIALIVTAFVWVNLRLALRLSPELPHAERFFEIEGQNVRAPDFGRLVSHLALPAALVMGAAMGLSAWQDWDLFLRYRHQVPFGETDPIFGRDIAFYFFTLPALEAASRVLLTITIVSLIGTAAVYAARGAMTFGTHPIQLTVKRGQRSHLLSLVAAVFLVLAWQAYLDIPNLVLSRNGPVAGASYTDIHATLPLLYVRLAVAVLVAILAAVGLFRFNSRVFRVGVGAYVAVLLGGWLYPATVQRFSVAPNELSKETPYIEYNIAATRKAFALRQIEERELSGETVLTARDIEENRRTINNIRLWDRQPLLDTFAQIQEIRTYYEFQSVDNDRYRIDGEMQQVMLSARELSAESLPNRNWINEQLTFTHGYGLAVGPVNQVTPEGLPVLFVKDIPPGSSVPSLKVDRPEIYFGELSNDRVYVKTKAKEFDYPAGDENVFASYAAEGGVAIGSTWRQLLFATRFGDLKLLLSNDLTPESRVLFYRNIRERLAKVAPFLRFDNDPYIVVSEGRLFWIADAYTVSDRYPYSQPLAGVNYIRNSVKAVVNAYDGNVQLYISDDGDPLIQTYARIFPGIMRPLSELPPDLRAHLRYPEDIFKIQTAVYSTYHMDQPQVFYNKEDQWVVASMAESEREGESHAMEPYYTIMKLPDEGVEEFILMLPFTPKQKDNMAAWMVARSDGDNYGRLLVYRFPKQKLVFGPKQVVARINQDAEISRQLSLWNQRGSQVIFGPLMVIPIKESLIYVQPLYLRAETGKIPELRRVIVVAENRIVMEPTLDASLAQIFGSVPYSPVLAPAASAKRTAEQPPQGGEAAASTQAPADARTLAAQAKQHYNRALQAQREGDWARYGEEIKRLGAVLEQMPKQ